MDKIIYRTETGIAIITPAHSVAEAMKDIPKGAEYKIIDESELPQDQTYCDAWKYDFTIDSVKVAEIDAERAESAELAAMPDLVKSLESRITTLEEATKEVR